ncbi:hypothetical protein DNU06_12905 [Putridiphycobacter roseus]|uniref:Endonuclease/exonuclease/phosphatase domain-containing protein n=1 Tax=Putridiphycobacter roseus TaxID=2219161 RepID=A0A2W1N0I4_9FLAO|nr:hypothetical protein [Putridiphycobacter roseus]PZE16441.1 hypothetical protein DNU06_12905 [Putridiphycobacter roseus]
MSTAKTILCLTVFIGQVFFMHGQNPQASKSGIRIMFYNVENLFHPSDDPLKKDEEFTPDGTRYWTNYRYWTKLKQIAQNIIAIGEWEPPAIVGLCEVENIQCLNDLVHNTPLKAFDYKIIHQESKDNRGIDVAFIYRPAFFPLINFHSFVLNFPDQSRSSRDILMLSGLVGKDTLHCFVNHWPSRYGGQLATAPKRGYAALVLKSKIDSIQRGNPNANILAMGDFNDYPNDVSLSEILAAHKDSTSLKYNELINLSWQFVSKTGTNKYQHEWHVLDQFIINKKLMTAGNSLHTDFELIKIFSPEWLLEPEKDGFGKKPYRTYMGYKYQGGFSDHLPIYLDIMINK